MSLPDGEEFVPARTSWTMPQVYALIAVLGFVGWMLCLHQPLTTALEGAGGSAAIVLGVGTVPVIWRRITGKVA